MSENNEAPVQGVQTSSIQEVVTVNKSLTEGLQNSGMLKKGYQNTDAPSPQSPPQSVNSSFTYEEVLAAPPSAPAPVVSPQPQVSNTETSSESK